MRRFERIYDVVEPVEEYRAGGYHPVHLGDIFHQRYHIIGKWAFGQFSTVWLARDSRLQKHVSLKIVKADISLRSRELSILLHLSESDTEHPGKGHVLQLLDHFEHQGPNGLHLCLVFPVMLSDGEVMTVRDRPRYSGYVREISKQILQGLEVIHSLGLIHGDLQPANILFTVTEFSNSMIVDPELSPVHWRPGVEVDNSAPRYLLTSQRPRGMLDDADFSTLEVRLGDLGGAMWNANDDFLPVTPTALRAPELIKPRLWDQKIDIWAVGCLIFQLATNEPLFPLASFGCSTDEVHEILQSFMQNLFESGYQKFIIHISERLPTDFGKEETEKLAIFLWSALQECPEDRGSATDLLNHPFLTRTEEVDG